MCLILYSPVRLSSVSVVFDFNISLNDVAPVSPMPLPDIVKRKENGKLWMDVFCVSSFFLYSPHRLSAVSVLFDFNASLNDVAPVPSIPLPVGVRERKKVFVVDVFCVSFFCLYPTD